MKAVFQMPVVVKNRYLEEINPWGKVILGAGILGVATGIVSGLITRNKKDEEV